QKATNPALWHYLALLRLKQDDAAGYRAVCADMRQRFGRVPDPGVSNSVAWTCSLAPDALPDPEATLQLALRAAAEADRAIQGTIEARNGALYMNTLGAASYRSGQFERAVAALGQAVRLQGGGGTPADWLLLAMAYHRLGRTREARDWLDRSKQ